MTTLADKSETKTTSAEKSDANAELTIACAAAVIFVAGFVASLGWPQQAAFLPQAASGVGATAALYTVTRNLFLRARGRGRTPSPSSATTPTAEKADDEESENILVTASARRWGAALAWLFGYIAALLLFGIFTASVAFSFCYLRFVGKRGWLFSAGYAAALAVIMWTLLRVVTYVSTPTGMLFHGG